MPDMLAGGWGCWDRGARTGHYGGRGGARAGQQEVHLEAGLWASDTAVSP